MGELGGFLKITRAPAPERDPRERVADYREIYEVLPAEEAARQGARCMECGVPFCHDGCPLGNLIPDWNDLVYQGRWREAIEQLHATNDFPEWTGLICPAPCEPACVLSINDDPVSIKQIELAIVERAWKEGWIVPHPPAVRSGRSVGVVGSGPAGLAAAAHLNRAGHEVVVYERDERPGGLLRFGVPDFKLEKWIIDRRVRILEEEGIEFRCGVDVGVDLGTEDVRAEHDAVVLATGARVHRDLDVPGSELEGVHPAMDYLYSRNRWVAAQGGGPQPREGSTSGPAGPITAAGKHVVVIGGGDTGMDCLANALREGAASVTTFDTYEPLLPNGRYPDSPWPAHPRRTLTTYALDEGAERQFQTSVRGLHGAGGRVTGATIARVEGRANPVAGSEWSVPADLVLVAIGFTGPERGPLLTEFDVANDERGNVLANESDYATSVPGVFATGDVRRGQSLIVWAISEGRRAALSVDRHLAGLGAVPVPA